MGLSFSMMYGAAHAADKKTSFSSTKHSLSNTKTLETETTDRRERNYGGGYNGYNTNNYRRNASSLRPKTALSLQQNILNEPVQEAASRKTQTPAGFRAPGPVSVRQNPTGSAGRGRGTDGYYGYSTNYGRNAPSSIRPKTARSLQQNALSKPAQEAIRNKPLTPAGFRAPGPIPVRKDPADTGSDDSGTDEAEYGHYGRNYKVFIE